MEDVMKFKGKKILVICKETYSYPLYYLSKEWMKDNEVAAFFINPSESQYNKCLLNDTTYYKFLDLGISVFTSNDIAAEFTRHVDSPIMDESLLLEYEKKYTYYKTLNEQILSSQFFTRHYHYRNYMKNTTYEQQMYWLQLNYLNIEKILDDFLPDVIIDTDCAELGRTALAEVAHYRSIPYMTIEYPRFETYKFISFQLGYGMDGYMIEKYKKNLTLSDDDLSAEIDYVNNFKKQDAIMSKEYKGDITSSYHAFKYKDILKRMKDHIAYFIEQDFCAHNYRLKKTNHILYPNSFQYVKFYWNYYRRRNDLMKKNSYFTNPKSEEKYVYMPLHLIPESSTFVKAPYYIDEYNIIEAVSKALPAGWYLYVKEHQAMLGEREENFYSRVNKLPNVKMVQINYYKDPKPWIIKSQAVVTITGTSAYEAALMGKNSIIFGDVPFGVIEGVHRVDSFESLPAIFREIKDKPCLHNVHSCASYIKTIKDIGRPVNIKLLLKEGLSDLRYDVEPSPEYINALNDLRFLYENAYEMIIDMEK